MIKLLAKARKKAISQNTLWLFDYHTLIDNNTKPRRNTLASGSKNSERLTTESIEENSGQIFLLLKGKDFLLKLRAILVHMTNFAHPITEIIS